MSKLEELKRLWHPEQAHLVVGESGCMWSERDSAEDRHYSRDETDQNLFDALAHNMMPDLLEAVELVRAIVANRDYATHVNGHMSGDSFAIQKARILLEKLK